MQTMKDDAQQIYTFALAQVAPDEPVQKAVAAYQLEHTPVYVVAIGKAAWSMARAAQQALPSLKRGIVLTKYHHSEGEIPGFSIYEAGHPVPDQASVEGTAKILSLVEQLSPEDTVLFLVSGGGSSLFEAPLSGISLEDIQNITSQLLRSGASINEINTLRKRLSRVKGGRFAQLCAPAQVKVVVLSDVVGDSLDVIASGPAYPDCSTVADVERIVAKYAIVTAPAVAQAFAKETPKELPNVSTTIVGSVALLCKAAAEKAAVLGYTPYILSTQVEGEARQLGAFLATVARELTSNPSSGFMRPCAIILGGEPTVVVKGTGTGGRNQELALAAAEGLAGLRDTLLVSIGSDGTDGPTDAAGGIVTGTTLSELVAQSLSLRDILANNDAYHGLDAVSGLLRTGATGTNVNDLIFLLCR